MTEQHDVQPSQGEQLEEETGFAAAAREQAGGEPVGITDDPPAEAAGTEPADEASSPA